MTKKQKKKFNIRDGVLLSFKGDFESDVLEIPEGTIAIGDYAFHRGINGESVKSLFIPSSLQVIGDSAFCGLLDLEEIIVSEGNKYFYVKDNCLIETNTKTLIFTTVRCETIPECEVIANYGGCNINTTNTVKIPASVKIIGKNAFRGARFYNMVFPETAPEIGAYALADCNNLKFVTLPNDLKIIPNHMFCNDYALHFIDLPETLEIIDHCAFYNCDLFYLTIPRSVKYIADSIVGDMYSQYKLETVDFKDTVGWYLCSREETYSAALLAAQSNRRTVEAVIEAMTGTKTQFHTIPIDVTNDVNNATILNWYDLKYLCKR